MQITQATITPLCRKRGDNEAIEIALEEIRKKLTDTMSVQVNNEAIFKIIATVNR